MTNKQAKAMIESLTGCRFTSLVRSCKDSRKEPNSYGLRYNGVPKRFGQAVIERQWK